MNTEEGSKNYKAVTATIDELVWVAVLWIMFSGLCLAFAVPLTIDNVSLGPRFVPAVLVAGFVSLAVGTTATALMVRHLKGGKTAPEASSNRLTRNRIAIGAIAVTLMITSGYLASVGQRELEEWFNTRKAEAARDHFAVIQFLDGDHEFHPDALNQTLAELEDSYRELEGNWTMPDDAGLISAHLFGDLMSYREWRRRDDSLGSIHCTEHGPVIAIPLEKPPSSLDGDYFTRTPTHEVVHGMICQSLGREKFNSVPRWFHEGIAEYHEAKGILRIKLRVENRVQVWRNGHQLFEPDRFCAGQFYPSDRSETSIFYSTSQELVEVLAARHGIEALHLIVDDVRKGTSFDQGMKARVGGDCRKVYWQWSSSF